MNLEKIITKRNSELSKKIDKHKIPKHVAIIMVKKLRKDIYGLTLRM